MKIKTEKYARFLTFHKKVIIIVSSITLFVIVVVVGVLFSLQTWNQYSDGYHQHFSQAKTDIDSVILQTTKTKTDMTGKLSRVIQIQNKIKSQVNSYCQVNPLVVWQRFITVYSDKIKNCETHKTNLDKVLHDLSNLTEFLSADNKLSAIISAANEKTVANNQSEKWNLIEPLWRQAIIDISKLPNTADLKLTKTISTDVTTKIAEAWQQLASSNTAKDRQKFEDARNNLNKAYISLATIADNSKSETDKLISNLSASYNTAF